MSQPFLCPICKSKIPTKELFSFSKEHITKCSNCGAELKPKNIKSWNFGFFIGLMGVLIPAYLVVFIFDNFPLGILVGLISGIISVLGVAFYVKKNTIFEKY